MTPLTAAKASWVYPRVCGGTRLNQSLWSEEAGLSPRVRGNRGLVSSDAGYVRSIPACAGEPGQVGDAAARAEVYPRVCGGTSRSRPATSRR